jgi:stalled ribosome rescue protein Dom34
MSEHHHAIVWIDHRDAKIFLFGATGVDQAVLHSHASGHHLQHRANVTGSGHRGVDEEFFKRVVAALTHSGALLVTGPGNARTELHNYIEKHHPDLARRIANVEPLDHPSDGVLLDLARKYFKADNRMHA